MSDLFYRAVIQEVLLFGSDSWTLSDTTMKSVESNHVGFLLQITRKRARQQEGRALETPEA